MSRHRQIRRRRHHRQLSGRWADAHPGFPWYGLHWAWHVFLIWPGILGGLATIVHGPSMLVYNAETGTWERKARAPAG
jgi:hypothetical protein